MDFITDTYLLISSALVLTLFLSILSWRITKRKKTIDQFESDARILLVFLIIISFYLLFLCVSFAYITIFIPTKNVEHLIISIYLLFPPCLGILLYVLFPWLWGRYLHSRKCSPPEKVKEIAHLLNISVPAVRTTPLKISPFVYGRSNNPIFVIPENMESLTEKEQKAVIIHELSHIKQGDVGFFTWLTLLTRGFTYWVLPLPLILLSGFGGFYSFILDANLLIFFFLPVFIVILIFLKNSLSRTRESIADAYVIFHGLDAPLKSALYTYAAKKASQHENLSFYRDPPFLKSFLSTHPPLQKRFYDVDKKTFISEDITTLSCEIAFWIGITCACLFYNILYSIFFFYAALNFFFPVEPFFEIFFAFIMCIVASAVAIPYIFSTTKAPLLLSDMVRKDFVLPLLRNGTITLVTAAGIVYVLSQNRVYTEMLIVYVLLGYTLLSIVFAASRSSPFRHGNWYLLLTPFVWCILFWVPVHTIPSFFSGASLMFEQTIYLLLGVLLLTIAHAAVLTARGIMYMEREEKTVALFGKRKEFSNDYLFVFIALFGMFLIPAVIALGTYTVLWFLDSLKTIPVIPLLYGSSSVLLFYGRKKSDILYFTELHFLCDILSWENDVDSPFIHQIINTYQSSDGGFDYAGYGFSTQKETFYAVKTAKTLKIPLEKERIKAWIYATEGKPGGFALFPGGYPRVEGLYYAVQSLSLMGVKKVPFTHAQWVLDSFTGEYFTFSNDTCSVLLPVDRNVSGYAFLSFSLVRIYKFIIFLRK